ncbi:MAG: hypothetical protein A3G84_05195 [Chloroflexi bacterium RIFCSPLOWO2_12_FULL_71_12]|nr:MAG: hypothetical protein A2082_02320 [Chloroflexi bacterium GWC2_70_10]OGO71839.1 MAG: hypothetical protein A3H36_08630 [Chloroflexi bacterium RIFCSPLOWO2_02_FULL_71_16]OGO74392.1 MAG: hypothetical protein A3G84_05195 [Chloroflexi bacterium RIFCSPLOWO2_12_FULL_71_12]
MDQKAQRAAAERAAGRIDAANADRDDSFQDIASGELQLAFDAFRPPPHERQPGIEDDPHAFEGDLPPRGENELLDALRDLARELDASPETVHRLAGRALELSREVSAARR